MTQSWYISKAAKGLVVWMDDSFGKLVLEDVKEKKKSVRGFTIKIDFELDTKFFAILPALNLNLHCSTLEFEWLFFGIYISKIKLRN